jgi:hypothetical protein
MRTNQLLLAAAIATASSQAKADTPVCFQPVSVQPQAHQDATLPVTLQLFTRGKYDTVAQAIYGDKAHWVVNYKTSKMKTWTAISVADLNPKPLAGEIPTSPTLRVTLVIDPAITTDGRDMDWGITVTGVDPNCNAGLSALALAYPPAGTKLPQDTSFFSPVAANQTATVSLTGSFTAGGGAKPIYAIKEVGNIAPFDRYRIAGLLPVVTSEVDINQSVKAGSEPAGYRSRIDPDTISAGVALWKVKPVQKGPLYDLTTHLQIADFEFARTDPSSAYTGGFGIEAIGVPLQKHDATIALNSDLYFGVEAGRNLKKPATLDKVVVDLSNYSTIFRGVTGADLNFAVASSDLTATVFSVGATYRVRLPAFDEPYVTDFHQTKAVGLSTKARNWVDVTFGYNPFKWQYFKLTAEYKYGSLPPVFGLVDHSATIGVTFSALQSSLVSFK